MEEIDDRRSIRKYTDQKVEPETIIRLIDAARLAPSGHNRQPWRFIVVTDDAMKESIAKVSHDQNWMLTAPVFIVCIADMAVYGDTAGVVVNEETAAFDLKRIIRDTAIATEHLVLEAVRSGLGTCWVAWFEQKGIRPVLGIPEDKFVVSVITVGYPDENPKQRPRKATQEIVRFGKW